MQELCQKHKIAPVFTVEEADAVLSIHDMEKPDALISFAIPMSQAQLKACHPVQNLGAVLTYERRYLYMIAFEIVEADILDALTEDPRQEAGQEAPRRSFVLDVNAKPEAELERLWAFAGWNPSGIADYMNNYAERNKQPVNSLLYEKVLNEQVAYLKSEAEKGNPQYAGMTFDDGMPF